MKYIEYICNRRLWPGISCIIVYSTNSIVRLCVYVYARGVLQRQNEFIEFRHAIKLLLLLY